MKRRRLFLALLHGIAIAYYFAWRRGTWAPPGPPSAETLRQENLDQQIAIHRAEEEERRREVQAVIEKARRQDPRWTIND